MNYKEYLIEREIIKTKIRESQNPMIDKWAKNIADLLGIDYKGAQDISGLENEPGAEKFKGKELLMFNDSPDKSGSAFMVNVPIGSNFTDIFRIAKYRLIDKRKQFNLPVNDLVAV